MKFATLAAVDEALGDLLPDLNTRLFKRLPGSRESAYRQLDRPALKALLLGRYEFARYHEARVNIDYHIAIDEHFYSVPQALVHQRVEARATARSVEILHRGERVAAHARSYVRFGYTTLPEHLPAAHRAHLEWSPGRLIRWGEKARQRVRRGHPTHSRRPSASRTRLPAVTALKVQMTSMKVKNDRFKGYRQQHSSGRFLEVACCLR